MVVRQALAILEDDRQIVRLQGRGTFVARPKLEHRAGGLSRLLIARRGPEVDIRVLDKRVAKVKQSTRRGLDATAAEPGTFGASRTPKAPTKEEPTFGASRTPKAPTKEEPVLRVTTLLSLRSVALAIGYSFFHRAEASWRDAAATVGRSLPTSSYPTTAWSSPAQPCRSRRASAGASRRAISGSPRRPPCSSSSVASSVARVAASGPSRSPASSTAATCSSSTSSSGSASVDGLEATYSSSE